MLQSLKPFALLSLYTADVRSRRSVLRAVRYLSIGCLGLVSCETVVDVDVPNHTPRLVINTLLEAGVPAYLILSESQSILSKSELQSVSGATVTLWEEGQAVPMTESTENPGFYYSDFKPSAGKTYTLQVSKEGYEPIEAMTLIRPLVAIREIAYDTTVYKFTYPEGDSVVTEENIEISEVRLTFDDPADERNYYEVLLYRNEVYYQEIYDEEGNYVRTDTVRGFEQQYLTSDDPALTGGGGDFLAGDDAAYGDVLTFGDEFLNGKTYTLRFEAGLSFRARQEDERFYVMLRTISEAQYRYLRSADLQYENDGNVFAEPVQVYSNVENGYGIFAGYSADSVLIEFE